MRGLISLSLILSPVLAVVLPRSPVTVLISNDDGWATANIRALYSTLTQAGFDTILSAPAENKSGSSSYDSPPTPIGSGGGQFGSIPPNSPPTGFNATDPRLNYVNSYPVTSVKHGLTNVAPKFFDGRPELVVSGPNVGENLSVGNLFSGTVGAAVEAAKQGIPAIAFSGVGGSQHSYTEPDSVAPVYAQLALKIVETVVASGKPYLPEGYILNVNFADSDASTCTSPSDFRYIFTRVNFDINPFTDDVHHCGTNHLPTELSVIRFRKGCHVSISVMDTKDKFDVDKPIQKVVRDKIQSILSCL